MPVGTRGPHSAIGLQHHAVVLACRDRLGACVHDRWRNPVYGDHGMSDQSDGTQRVVCAYVCACEPVWCVCLCVYAACVYVCWGEREEGGHVDGCMRSDKCAWINEALVWLLV